MTQIANMIELNADKPLIINSDLENNISFANSYYLEINGCDCADLIGQPVRSILHSDVPKAVCDDLFETLQSNNPWRGRVKIRTPAGDAYWVALNVSPVYRDGVVTGGIWISTAITDKQVKVVEALFSDIKNGRAQLQAGNVYRGLKGVLARSNPIKNYSIRTKLILLVNYSVFKELYFSTSLLDGAYAKTNFGDVFRRARDINVPGEVVFEGFKQYGPSYDAPASFIGTPLFDGEDKVGVTVRMKFS